MHMSSASPWSRTPGVPRVYVGEYRGIEHEIALGGRGNITLCNGVDKKGVRIVQIIISRN